MKISSIIAIFIYTMVFSIIGAILIALSLNAGSINSVTNWINYLFQTENIRLSMALTGFLLIVINISIAQLSIGKLKKHKTIAFENPNGQVSLSLLALEDEIKKVIHKMEEVKEAKVNITAGKTGIELSIKTVFYSDINIPDTTERMQGAIRTRLQEMLGIEEKLSIKIHITKIVRRGKTTEQKNLNEPEYSGFKGEIQYGR